MTGSLFWLIVILAGIAVAAAGILLLPGAGKAHPEDTGVSVQTSGSIVTVRKVGHLTSVTICGIHDHWEGSDGIDLPPAPIETTIREEAALYNEYMSPGTSATRKYEIADELYAMGYSLPLIPGLIDQWRREQAELKALRERDADARAALEPTPPDFSSAGEDNAPGFTINHALRNIPQPDIFAPGEELEDIDASNQ